MKRASLFASAATVAAVLLTGVPAGAQSSGPFQDVPADHWAYESVDKLQKAGIVIGYPDKTYGGKRSMTRYEFAVAIARLLDKMTTAPTVDLTPYVLRTELDQYAKKSDLAGLATKAEVDELRKLLREFETELTTLGVDLDAVKKRVDALEGRVKAIENELKRVQIGGEFNFMARGNHRSDNSFSVRDYDGFEVTGGRGSRGGVFADTRVFHDLDLNVRARLSDTATAEAKINFGNYLDFLNSIGSYSGARSDRPAVGGYPGQAANQDQQQSIINAYVKAPIRLPGVGGIDLTVGRLPLQLTSYTLKLIDVDQYFFTSKTDLGDVPVDGVKGSFKLGPVGFTGFAAKVDPVKYLSNTSNKIIGDNPYGLYAGAGFSPYVTYNTANAVPASQATIPGAVATPVNTPTGGLQAGFRGDSTAVSNPATGAPQFSGNRPVQSPIAPNRNGAMAVEQLAGLRASFGTERFGSIGATYIVFAGNPSNPQTLAGATAAAGDINLQARQNLADFDRVFLYGLDINTNLGGVGVVGSYTITDTAGTTLQRNAAGGLTGFVDTETRTKRNGDNYAWDLAGTLARGNFSLTAGYREVMPFFGAPGSWTRVGSYTNPVDIKGPYVNGKYNFSPRLALVVAGQFYQGTNKAAAEGGLTDDDEIQNLRAGLKFGLTSASAVDLGIERTEYDVARGARFGGGRGKPLEYFYNIGYGFSFNPNSSIKLLYQIIDYRDGSTGFDTQNGKGGVAAAQFSVKF